VSLGEQIASAVSFSPEVIRTTERPVQERAGIAVLRGNICPNGAIIKPSAASASLLKHTGQAVVFSSIEELKARIDDPALSVDKDSVLVLKGCGPKGYPGMPEVGNMPLPQKLLKEGVTDMVRLSDARMSGTAFGTVVLHIAPESAVGGPFAFIRDGDTISLDVEAGTLDVLLSDEELAQRKAEWKPEQTPYTRGYYKLYQDTVLQADQGADLDFLVGASGHVITRESH
jgi:dihydroxy-acid dehydratase